MVRAINNRFWMHFICVLVFIVFSLTSGIAADAANAKKKASSSKPSSPLATSSRFADNGDGTVHDRDTGLVWLKDANVRKLPMPLKGARQYIHEMNSGQRPNYGYTDWRLPAINEIQTLADRSRFYPALAAGHPFTDVQNHFYWSSSTGTDIIDYVWIIDMASGEMTIDYVSACSYKFLWPVRSSWMPTKEVAGAVMTGGLNEYGQLGDGSTNSRDGLFPVGGMEDAIKVASGTDYAVAIKSDGSVWAWGRNNRGQLGNGSTDDSPIPILVQDLYKVTDISAGMYHTLALRADGSVWAWGGNSYGQLGIDSTRDARAPVKVKGLSNVVAIAAGMYHSVAVRSDGSVWSWGWNVFGQLGDDSTKTRTSPVRVKGLPNMKTVAAGLHHTVAIGSGGSVWAWGWNVNGLLGDGTIKTRLAPVKVKGLTNMIDVSAGLHHTIALKKDGSVWGWGGNEYSQLGKEGMDGSRAFQIPGLSNINKVAAGMYHSLALMKDGTIWVWGKDLKDKPIKPAPVRMWDVSVINNISGGKYFTTVVGGIGSK
jgi:alpha-tubulin suppressor-like RCC1 family protein